MVAGYVTVETAVPGGRAEVDVTRGEMLPADVPQAQIARDLASGAIVEIVVPVDVAVSDEDDSPPPHDPPVALAVPAGMSVSATETWVGDDVERAQLALVAETAEGGQNRKTLVARLEAVIAAAETGGGDPSNND